MNNREELRVGEQQQKQAKKNFSTYENVPFSTFHVRLVLA